MICNCGKSYKQEKAFNNHIHTCPYVDLDIQKVDFIGELITTINRNLFSPRLGSVKKYMKENNITQDDAYKTLLSKEIRKYRKSIWDSYLTIRCFVAPSEYMLFFKWFFATYKDVSLLSLRKLLTNEKIYFRFTNTFSFKLLSKRLDESILFLHENKNPMTDFEFVENILLGNISIYYVLFNDYLSTEWFGLIDSQLQNDLSQYIEIASKQIINNINESEYDRLIELGNKKTPKIYIV